MPDLFYRNPVDGYELILVPGGRAIFGSRADDSAAAGDERPQFSAALPDYYLGLYCVTNAQYAAFLSAVQPGSGELEKWVGLDSNCHVVRSGSAYAVDDAERYGDHPAVQVSWYGAEAYCEWSGLRLPSELEWEKGARGTEGLVYPWGNEWNGEYCRRAGNRGSETTCRVWEYPEGVSVWGCYNLSGNVWEWCADWYNPYAYKRYAKGDLRPPRKGEEPALRGASWARGTNPPFYFRCACRDADDPVIRDINGGFRCARGLP